MPAALADPPADVSTVGQTDSADGGAVEVEATRTCRVCGESKPIDQFPMSSASTEPPRYKRLCNTCRSAQRREQVRVVERACEACGARFSGRYARLCEPCRSAAIHAPRGPRGSKYARPWAPAPAPPHVEHDAAEDGAIERTCKVCGETKPLTAFMRTTSKAGGESRYLYKCKRCRNAERAEVGKRRREAGITPSSSTEREHRARMRQLYGHVYVDAAPSPALPRLLVELLRDSRRVGLTFDQAWPEDLEFALSRIRWRNTDGALKTRDEVAKAERASWREALEGTVDAWRASYNRLPGPVLRLSLDLLHNTAQQDRPDHAVIG